MIIITGASKGIGRYLFDRFRDEDFPVVGTRNSTIEGIARDLDLYSKVDISDYDQVRTWVDRLTPQLSNIILINCAGISYTCFAHKSDINLWKEIIHVNIVGTFNVIHCLLPLMRTQKYGRIINFSSVVTKLPTPGVSAYATSKAGLIGLTKSLAVENASLGITANAISLGYASLGMGVCSVSEQYQEIMKQRIPAGRFCNPAEIYNTVRYFIDTEYINGSNVDLNGGLI